MKQTPEERRKIKNKSKAAKRKAERKDRVAKAKRRDLLYACRQTHEMFWKIDNRDGPPPPPISDEKLLLEYSQSSLLRRFAK